MSKLFPEYIYGTKEQREGSLGLMAGIVYNGAKVLAKDFTGCDSSKAQARFDELGDELDKKWEDHAG